MIWKRLDKFILVAFAVGILAASYLALSGDKRVDLGAIQVKEIEYEKCSYLVIASPESVNLIHKANCTNHLPKQ